MRIPRASGPAALARALAVLALPGCRSGGSREAFCEQVVEVCHRGRPVAEAVAALMARELGAEVPAGSAS